MRKRGCAVSGDDSNTERVTDKVQIQMRIIKQPELKPAHFSRGGGETGSAIIAGNIDASFATG